MKKSLLLKLFDFFEKIDYHVQIIGEQDTLTTSISVDSPYISDKVKQENILQLKRNKKVIFITNKTTITMNIYYTDEDIPRFLK